MVKASLKLANGTQVTLEGEPTEVQKLLQLYNETSYSTPATRKQEDSTKKPKRKAGKGKHIDADETAKEIPVADIVNAIKGCDEAESIEANILDRVSQVDRVLLPLYVAHEHIDERLTLTSGEVATVLSDLRVPLAQPNVSRTLSVMASKYVMGDKARKGGRTVRYKLNRRGISYINSVIAGDGNEKQK
ncbi:MAG: hypothetical protein JXA30_00310 [Deltaproteobacteria bacterium]|nr:hypothetical protein [Deltaproteobacteria bacterium]